MSSDVFQFVTIRPPQQVDDTGTAGDIVDLGLEATKLISTLRVLNAQSTRDDIIRAVDQFVASADFVGSFQNLDPALVAFMKAVRATPAESFWESAGPTFTSIFQGSAVDLVASPPFIAWYGHVVDSIVSAVVDPDISSKVRALLVRAARALWLIRRIAALDFLSQKTFLTAPLLLPSGIFPLPPASPSYAGNAAVPGLVDAAGGGRQTLRDVATDLSSNRAAIQELLGAFEQTEGQRSATITQQPAEGANNLNTPGFYLSDEAVKKMTPPARKALQRIGVGGPQIDLVRTLNLLEQAASRNARLLYGGRSSRRSMVRIGNLILPKEAVVSSTSSATALAPADGSLPGPCPPTVVAAPTSSPALPEGFGEARVLGIADLMVVEQELARYELGEISLIENVLKSELRSRRVTTTDTFEETDTTQTQTTTDKEQDTSSTDRFELQTQSQNVISDNASKAAGLTIHASYGPSVDATANYNTSSSTSSQQSNTAASNYAKEITTKAVQNVQTSILTARTVTTINKVKETNKHAFDNRTGTTDIVGVYRFVDKIYSAQVVSYGKRLMLEFIVPEPAAFLRYALTNAPLSTVPQTKPDPPGYCMADGTTFVALQATDISPDNYLYWASKYGAQNVTPPPVSTMLVTGSKKSPDTIPLNSDNEMLYADLLDITIPDGYLGQTALVNIYGENEAKYDTSGNAIYKVVFQIQDQKGFYPATTSFSLSLQPTSSFTVGINSNSFWNYEVLVTVLCTVSTGTMLDWQFQTFSSILSAYNDLQSAYDQAMKEATLQASDGTVSGTNPDANRIVEQTELKKGCVSLLTAQSFDLFGAVNDNVAPNGYPEIDFVEAKAQGPYIQFFEQSFEWENMVYLFYPYFWSKKATWTSLAQLTDADPLFAQFLQAGAARVQVPVRPGFEDAMMTYLSTGAIWNGEGNLINSDSDGADPQYLSIIQELKSQTGDNNVDGVGTLSVTNASENVTGSGTEFTVDDENRRIIIAGNTYIIDTVQSMTSITLTSPYSGPSAQAIGYATGGKLIGQPWEIKIPTNLIKLDDSFVIA